MGFCHSFQQAKEQAQKNADTFRSPWVAFITTSGDAWTDKLSSFTDGTPPGAEVFSPQKKHTPEPWHQGAGNGVGSIFADGDFRMRLEQGGTALYPIAVTCRGYDPVEDEANEKRIVDCVNACADIKDVSAVKDMVAVIERFIDEYDRSRDVVSKVTFEMAIRAYRKAVRGE